MEVTIIIKIKSTKSSGDYTIDVGFNNNQASAAVVSVGLQELADGIKEAVTKSMTRKYFNGEKMKPGLNLDNIQTEVNKVRLEDIASDLKFEIVSNSKN